MNRDRRGEEPDPPATPTPLPRGRHPCRRSCPLMGDGVALELTAKGTKYYKDGDLSQGPRPQREGRGSAADGRAPYPARVVLNIRPVLFYRRHADMPSFRVSARKSTMGVAHERAGQV